MGRRDVVELIIIIIKRTVLVFETCRNSSRSKLNAREKSLRSPFSSGAERVSKRDFVNTLVRKFPTKFTKRILLFRVCEFFGRFPPKRRKISTGGKRTNKRDTSQNSAHTHAARKESLPRDKLFVRVKKGTSRRPASSSLVFFVRARLDGSARDSAFFGGHQYWKLFFLRKRRRFAGTLNFVPCFAHKSERNLSLAKVNSRLSSLLRARKEQIHAYSCALRPKKREKFVKARARERATSTRFFFLFLSQHARAKKGQSRFGGKKGEYN